MCSLEVGISIFHRNLASYVSAVPEHFLKYTTLCGVLQNASGVMHNPAPCTANTSAVAGPVTAAFPKTGLNGRTGRAAQPALPQARVSSPFPSLTLV